MNENPATFTSLIEEELPTPEELNEQIHHFHHEATANKARMLNALGQLDEHTVHDDTATPTRLYIQRELNLPTSLAYEYLRIARGLRRYRYLYEHFAAGNITYSTVRFLLPRMTEDNEVELTYLATTLTYADLRLALAGISANPDRDPTQPYLHTRTRDDGMLEFSGLLPAVTGQEFLAALKIAQLAHHGIDNLESEADPDAIDALINDAVQTEQSCPGEEVYTPPKPLSAQTICEPVSRYGPPTPDAMFSALVGMIQMVRTTPVSPLRAPGAHVAIVATEDGRVFMPQNPSAPSKAVESYIANARARLHLIDANGLALYVGRSQRFATDGQVQALLTAWGYQCAMPGCNHQRFIQIHHIKPWEDYGATDLDNLIPLCSTCHATVSNGSTTIITEDEEIHFTFANGTRYTSRNRMLPQKVPAHAM